MSPSAARPSPGRGRSGGPSDVPVERRGKGAFEHEQPALDLDAGPAAVAAEPVRGDHAVALDDEGDGVVAHHLADDLGVEARAAAVAELAVGDDLPVRDG